MIEFPNKKYDIIYCDPPWQYQLILSGGSAAKNHYPTMSAEELIALPVKDIAADNCLMFMWIGSPKLITAIRVGYAWGFNYSTFGFVWDKQIPCPGSYTLSQCEVCLIWKKGKIPTPRGSHKERQFLSVRRGAHSSKPLHVKESIERMFPEQKKIELFARRDSLFDAIDDGWDYWGNQA